MKQIAKDISNGKITITHQKLDTETSNQVFEEFLERSFEKCFSESCQHIKNLLTITEIDLDCYYCDENVCKMIYDQNIEELTLDCLNLCKMFRLVEERPMRNEVVGGDMYYNHSEERRDTTVRRVDIISVLEKMLNSKSRKKLKYLKIDGAYLEIATGWVEKLSALLPSLESLQFHFLPFEASVIQSVYDNFPNLTCLEISGSKISNLNGISKLQNLTYLKISGIEFGGKDDMKELFTLRKLRALDIDAEFGKEPWHKNLVYYLESNRILPELRYMNCSGCEITEEMLQKLVETHPKLETIILLQTSLAHRSQLKIPDRKLRLMTRGSIGDCLRTIQFWTERDLDLEYLDRVLFEMKEMLILEHQVISKQELRDCLKLMCDFAYTAFYLQDDAFQVLEEICRGTRASIFTFDERQYLIYSLIRTIHKPYDMCPYTPLVTSKSVWRILNNPIIFDTSPANADQICEDAAEVLDYGCQSSGECARILGDQMEKMSVERGRALAQNKRLWGKTMDLMDIDDNVNQPFYMKLVQTIYKVKNRKSDGMDKQCITVVSNSLRDPFDNEYKTIVVETAKVVIGYMSFKTVKLILDRPWWLRNYLKLLYNNNEGAQQSATAFILLYLFPHPKPSLEEFLKDIREALEGFEYDEESEDHSSNLKWIQSHCNDQMTKNFCEFMIKEVEKEVVLSSDPEDDIPMIFRHYSFSE